MPGKKIAFEDADNDSTEIAEVLPNVAFFSLLAVSSVCKRSRDDQGRERFTGFLPYQGLIDDR
jgi:hypothetical protein